ncbi:equilibrative nucleoside transporter 3-like [Crassostrea virginica]|uniref:Equilibrative nucleoside transporter 1-like n=1 Tax=Crassostrea virginica TaxID=6565 RepID=A0A8B8E247_CRAVI|nr:equilibrative nucleoside transporter 1-like [Crassostrea virginica]
MDSEEQESLLPPSQSRRNPPPDRCHAVFVVFYFIGIGSLLPWNFFITANKYFQYKLRNTTLPWDDGYIKTDLQINFESSITVASTVPNVLFNFITAFVASRIPLKGRMVFSNVVVIVLFIITLVLVKIDSDNWQTIFYSFTLLSVIILSAASSVYMASMFGLAGMFPIQYMQAIMSGQAIGGVFAAVANILSIALSGSDERNSAFFFFAIATLTSLASLIGYLSLYTNDFSKYYLNYQEVVEIAAPDDINSDAEVTQSEHSVQHIPTSIMTPYIAVFKKIWLDSLGAGSVFFVSLTCFPALASAIVSELDVSSVWRDQYFSAVVCFLLFNMGDWCGRATAGAIQWPRENHRTYILLVCAVRLVFIPLIFFCNIQPRHYTEVVFKDDFCPLIFILSLGLTNGYFSTLCMMYGPKRVESRYAEYAGTFMSVSLTVGLAIGSLFGFLLLKLV